MSTQGDSGTQIPPVTSDPEFGAIIAWLRGWTTDGSDLDWNRLRRLAIAHGVAPLLHQCWVEQAADVPATLQDVFKRARQENALRGVLALRQRDELLAVLAHADIAVLVLKGAALGRRWYGELSLRPFVDIDLLVPRDQIAAANASLLEAGYLESTSERTDFHEVPLYRRGQPCGVEIHHELTSLRGTQLLTYEELSKRAVAPELDNPALRTLGPEDTLIHLCLHLLHHLQLTEGWALRYLCDMDRHLRLYALDWDRFAGQARTVGALNGCRAVLGLVVLVTGADVPSEWADSASGRLLVSYAVPDQLDTSHHFLAAFLAATAQGRFKQAVTMLLRTMVVPNSGGRRWGVRDLRPYRLLATACALGSELVTDPRHLLQQIRAWYAEGDNLIGRERLVAELFDQQDS